MKSFPHINYHEIKSIYDKCTRIIDLLESSLPIGKSVHDYIKHEELYNNSYAWEFNSSNYEGCVYSFGCIEKKTLNTGHTIISSTERNNTTVEPYYPEINTELDLKENTKTREIIMVSYFNRAIWMDDPSCSYHRLVHTQAEKALDAMKSDSDVNTMNISLASSLQFLGELEESDLNEGIYQYDTDLVKDRVEGAANANRLELQAKYDAEYEKQVEEYKKDQAERMEKKREVSSELVEELLAAELAAPKVEGRDSFLNGFFTALTVCIVSFIMYLMFK